MSYFIVTKSQSIQGFLFGKSRIWMTIILFSCLSANYAAGQIYTWVDEAGNKHYSDRVPDEYADQATIKDVDTHFPEPKDIQPPKQSIEDYRRAALATQYEAIRRDEENRRNFSRQTAQSPSEPTKEDAELSDYEKKLAEYNESLACFSQCQIPLYRTVTNYFGHDRTSSTVVRSGVNNEHCGHCKQVLQPIK